MTTSTELCQKSSWFTVSNPGKLPSIILNQRNSDITMDLIDSWDFNPLVLSEEDSFLFLEYLFEGSPDSSLFSDIPWGKMSAFLHEVRRGYRFNPYHRWEHAVDVAHTVFRYLQLTEAKIFLRPVDRVALLIGSIIHDIGHIGRSNQFLIDSNHELAGLFNDRSPLENFHCFKFFSILKLDACNIFASFSREDMKELRRVIIEAVINTDNAFHASMLKEVHALFPLNEPLQNSRMLITKFLLHAADVSNPCKPFNVCEQWALLVMEEFFTQGDEEKALGLPISPLNDRSRVQIPQSQVGFINFFIIPLEICKVKLFPRLRNTHALDNLKQWSIKAGNEDEYTKGKALFERNCPMIIYNSD